MPSFACNFGDRIKIIPENKLNILEKILEFRLPKSARLFNVLKFHLQKRIFTGTFYSFGEMIEKTNSNQFLLCRQKLAGSLEPSDMLTVSERDSENYQTEEFCKAFESFIEWDVKNVFGALSPELSSVVTKLCHKRGKGVQAFPCNAYTMTINTAITLDISVCHPVEVEVSTLSVEDAKKIAASWKFTTPDTEGMMVDSINNIVSAGVYVRLPGGQRHLASWVLAIQTGNYFSLKTDSSFQGRGFGALALKGICKFGAQNGFVPITFVETYNKKAMQLMKKIGMEHTDDILYVESI